MDNLKKPPKLPRKMPLGGKISAGAGRMRRPPLFYKYALQLCGNHHSLFDHRTEKRKRAKTEGLRKKSGSVVTKEESPTKILRYGGNRVFLF